MWRAAWSVPRSFFASIPNDLENKTEKHYQTIFYLLFRLMGQYVESEVKSSVGRADVVVQLQDVVYVFEFKYDGTPEEALAQIDSKQYAILPGGRQACGQDWCEF